jgi:hypothetical protein
MGAAGPRASARGEFASVGTAHAKDSGSGLEVRPRAARANVHARAACIAFVGLALAASVHGCGGGGGGGGGGGSGPSFDLIPGSEIGALEVVLPQAQSFVLHGTLPLAPGIFPLQSNQTPLGVLDYDGTPLPAQLEIVSRYPSAQDGADVVEVLARVRRDPAKSPGQRAQYRIAALSNPFTVPSAPSGMAALTSGPLDLPSSVEQLVSNPSGILISARDCFAHVYFAQPLAGGGSKTVLRHGFAKSTVRSYDVMQPIAPVGGAQGTLDHLFGVHAYVSTYAGEPVVGLDLRITNGHDGHSASALDNPLGKVYFDGLYVTVPNGWALVHDVDDPAIGTPFVLNNETVFPIVAPLANDKLHVMPSQGQFHRRMALVPVGQEQRAIDLLDRKGLGFARRGSSAPDAPAWLSWWNSASARYLPQRTLLPSLEHVGIGNIRNTLANEYGVLLGHMQNGTSSGNYPIASGVLGWAHPYGVSYGGMTGGAEIHIAEGVETLESASVEGYLNYELTHRMHSERHPNVLYALDGEPTSVEDWVIDFVGGDYVPMFFYMALLPGNDPFGFDEVEQFQVQAVAGQGRQPAYEGALLGFAPHDEQHLIRYTRSAKALVWMGNDDIAKDDLRMQAELFRLSWHPYFNTENQHLQSTGMAFARKTANDYPHKGLDLGRGEGWGIDVTCAAYSTSSNAWRAQVRPWFDLVPELFRDGQTCAGFLQATFSGQMLGGQYRARQSIEAAILDNALRGVLESVYQGEHAQKVAILKLVLTEAAYGMISPLAWDEVQHAPWSVSATGPFDINLPVYCSSLPADAHSAWVDNYQCWPTLGFAHELTGASAFLSRATEMAGGGVLLDKLQQGGLSNMPNRASLLALMQQKAGLLP